MDPKTLKNMLNSGAGGNSSALAPYSGSKKDEDLIDEDIDERILRLLGLEDVFDIDYGTYKTLLRESLAAARMSNSQIPAEEDQLLREEFKRVRGKDGRFKVKKKKITAKDIGRSSSSIVSYKNFVSLSKEVVSKQEEGEAQKIDSGVGDNLKKINETLDKILKAVISQGSDDKKRREKDRVSGERRKAQERESGLEKPLQVAKNLAKKIIAPFRGILDSVFRFLGFTFLGWLIGKYDDIQKWISGNKDKVKIVTRFLKDWGPALLGAFVLFATPFGKFIRTTLKMLRFFIPQIVKLIAKHPILALATIGAIGGAAKIKESERMKPLVEKNQAEIDESLTSKDAPWYEKLGAGFANQSLNAPGGPKNPIGVPMPSAMYSRGGSIFGFKNGTSIGDYFSGYVDKNSGVPVKGFGQDTQAFPIEGGGTGVLKPGEVVMNTGAVNAIGADKLLSWNRQFGGPSANKPINFTYKGGGIVGMQNGGFLGGMLPGMGSVMPPITIGNNILSGYKNQLFGIPFGETKSSKDYRGFGTGYSSNEMKRYNPQKYFTNIGGSLPKLNNRPNFVGNPFANFRGAAKRKEGMMSKIPYKPSGYSNIFGKPSRRQSGGAVPRGTSQFGEVPLIRAAMNAGMKGQELAAFLAQMSHETGGFKWSRELSRGKGMGYSGGSMYHGRGYTQLTHDYNYKHFGQKLGVDLLKDPDLILRDPNISARVAIEYWKERVRPNVKNWSDVFAHSSAINLPSATSPAQIRGYEDRVSKFNYYNKNLNTIVARSMPKPTPSPSLKPKPRQPSLMDRISGFVSGLFGDSSVAKPRRKQGGGAARFMNLGKVTTQTGLDVPGGLMGADTQYIPSLNVALQPGEDLYVVPKQAVPQMDSMVASIAPNSNAAKIQGLRGNAGPKVTFITLPNKVTSTPSKGGGLTPGKPQLPEFEVIMDSPKRTEVAMALGISDLV